MAAKTLQEAYNMLDPRQPVKPEQVAELFVKRPYSPVDRMKAQLQLSNRPLKLLFVGHRGAGKSSELAYLSTLLEEQFLSILIPLYDIFKSPTVNHIELVFAMTLRLLQQATDEALVPSGVVTDAWNKLLEDIYLPIRQLLFGADPIPSDKAASITIKLSLLAAELETKIGTESYTRNQVKEKFEGRIAELLDQIGHLSRLLEKRIGRKLILIVEDLDKFDMAHIRALFQDHARTLTAAYPNVIYSFPVAMRYDNHFREIEQSFDTAYMLPNIAITHRDGSVDEKGPETMWNILLRRIDATLFEPGVLDKTLRLSGGHVKTLIQLSQQAVLQAVVDGNEIVQERHLWQAQQGLRDDYLVMLKKAQVEMLRQLRDDADKDLLDTTQAKQDLLFNGSLLEYGNTIGPWADVNPIVLELLDREW